MIKFLIPILVIIVAYKYLITEYFVSNINTVNKQIIYNIVPSFDDTYIASTIPDNKSNLGTLIYTRSVKSNEWRGPINNCAPAPKSIIVDLSYDTNKRLLCTVMTKLDKYGIMFKLYRKRTIETNSVWDNIPSNENIRSILYDTDGILLGCSGDNGQIYKKKTKDIYSDWYGPINYDLPMNKIMYDKDGIMLGIGYLNHYVYKKIGLDWKTETWDNSNINKERVFDMYHDIDGCLIASSYKGIIKQINNNYLSKFIPYNLTKLKKETLTFDDIMNYRTGFNFNIKKNYLNPELNQIVEFKKIALSACKNRNTNFSKSNNQNLGKINQQKLVIDEIDQLIKDVKKRA